MLWISMDKEKNHTKMLEERNLYIIYFASESVGLIDDNSPVELCH